MFCSGNQREDCSLASDWAFWRALQKQFLENFDRSTFISIDRLRADIRSIEFKVRSIDFSGSPNFQPFPYEICHSSLIVLHKQKTQKLTKTLENNKAKGLTNANQGVQIHNIWHSSIPSGFSSGSTGHKLGQEFPSKGVETINRPWGKIFEPVSGLS